MLKLHLDSSPDAAWRAIRSPEVFRAVSMPFASFTSLEPDGFPDTWPQGEHAVRASAFGLVGAGEQVIDLAFTGKRDARLVHDTGYGVSGPLALLDYWHHTMAVSPGRNGGTLFRDRVVFDAGVLTPLVWPALWAFWQWRGIRLRQLAPTWT